MLCKLRTGIEVRGHFLGKLCGLRNTQIGSRLQAPKHCTLAIRKDIRFVPMGQDIPSSDRLWTPCKSFPPLLWGGTGLQSEKANRWKDLVMAH
mmetsp:Transcript_7824/g.18792  ORF Transcript_7824/g.18792 Transcript_7824/m.18792 type:complete len:93 (-) Transcript_7824:299-577(-)